MRKPNRVAGRTTLPAPTPPDTRVRVRWFLMPVASTQIDSALGQHRLTARPDAALAGRHPRLISISTASSLILPPCRSGSTSRSPSCW